MAEDPMDVSAPTTTEIESAPAVENSQPQPAETGEQGASETKDTPTKTDESGKKVYTEEERMRRKAYFKSVRDRKKLNSERYRQRQNQARTSQITPKRRNLPSRSIPDVKISFQMTKEEDKVLEFYKVKLSALKSTNEQLHKRLNFLVKENMRLLQMGPPLKTV
ncbi:uncharacterized protein LOC128987372 [Macrosteles quadrilineatus]|uniref:uncharacterized protein LOC128987372 n=1 Tax=Macrosteles quadrilineatus TaxID=74068 RepID=UPI0023E17222|nr:uncharacterized protein LOC128987372 [Macrosteles quadrilineatus]